MKAIQTALNISLNRGAVFLCIIIFVLTGHTLEAEYVFVVKSFYSVLQQSMSVYFPEALKNISESFVSINRIQRFLLSKEYPKNNKIEQKIIDKQIVLDKVSADWSITCNTLKNINLQTDNKGKVIAVVGCVASGKTSLLHVILEELSVKSGNVIVNGELSYTTQEPFLMATTIRQNILFDQPYDKTRYQNVINACDLNTDFNNLAYGDNSIVGDRGITLSGGQKARINLARAIYKNSDFYLLDDPLSAVDNAVGVRLFNNCILNFLKNKCVILVTHQVQYLSQCDIIYVMDKGKVILSGKYEDIMNSDVNLTQIICQLPPYNDVLAEESSINSRQNGEEQKFIEDINFGKIPLKSYKKYFFSGGSPLFIILILMFVTLQLLQSGFDYFESLW